MNYKYKFVIFDVDGTLLDTSEGILESVKFTIQQHHLNDLSKEQLLTFIGPPVQESFKKNYSFSDAKCQLLANTFRERYKNIDLLKARPYVGIFDVLEELKNNGILFSVATYKREDYAKTLLEYYGFNKYINNIYGADNENKLSKKDIIKLSIDSTIKTANDKIVYVGDTLNDMNASKELDIDFIGVNYGFGFKNEKNYANNPKDLLLYMR